MKAIPIILIVIMALLGVKLLSDEPSVLKEADYLHIAHLGEGDSEGLVSVRQAFTERNPGYDLHFFAQIQKVSPAKTHRLAFVQRGGGTAQFSNGESSKISVGDIVHLPPQRTMETDSLIDYLVFTVPDPLPKEFPDFIRPDWDDNITDTPGGCVTATGAYRRILLTWKEDVGPYVYHALNAHRVRITDSFTHYHPVEGGFDEFYLVQMVQPNAQLITSNQVEKITNPESIKPEDVDNLLQSTKLKVGDLVYLPRGIVHRGVDGVLAQVITIPGFIPGSEIGVDHHLHKINERFAQQPDLPLNQEASASAVIR
ncbi:MAG: hypothetical protein WBA23_15060 [Tunicatimonas sp.]|uniref:hypothetical protein n=1 Tax=Tunicatimonas sp. TaxID=1940096 RepID=UPI003C789465